MPLRLPEADRARIASRRFCGGGSHALEGRVPGGTVDRLEQVIDGRQLERIDRVLIVRGAGVDRRARPAEGSRDIEPLARHLDVEQDQVGDSSAIVSAACTPSSASPTTSTSACALSSCLKRSRAGCSSSITSVQSFGGLDLLIPDPSP